MKKNLEYVFLNSYKTHTHSNTHTQTHTLKHTHTCSHTYTHTFAVKNSSLHSLVTHTHTHAPTNTYKEARIDDKEREVTQNRYSKVSHRQTHTNTDIQAHTQTVVAMEVRMTIKRQNCLQ